MLHKQFDSTDMFYICFKIYLLYITMYIFISGKGGTTSATFADIKNPE